LDCRDQLYKATSEEKLGHLLRAYLIRCAEELPENVHKLNLFLEFRNDKTVRSIVHRAKSILAADHTFFSPESKHARQKGPELYERVARVFVEQVLERQAGEVLTLTDAYLCFCEYMRRKGMEPVKRTMFKHLVPPASKEKFDLGVCNDLTDEIRSKWHCGWKGISALNLEPAEQAS
jgi:hypothetical protein